MFKSSDFFNEFCCQPSDSMTPIRDYSNDYFHKNDDKLPKARFPRYGQGQTVKGNSTRSNQLVKRPASLSLDSSDEPLSKKQYSPVNVDQFSKAVKIRESPVISEVSNVPKCSEFFSVVRSLYQSEYEYGLQVDLANVVYRDVLHENKNYRNKLLEPESNEEFLLFGNLETIASISGLFLTSLKEIIMKDSMSREIDEDIWKEINANSSLRKRILLEFDIGKVFQTNFFRIKSTYLSYCGSHRKQMELFESMRYKNPHLFYRWYEHCYKSAGNRKLEDILNKPVKRISEWLEFLETLRSLSSKTLGTEFCQAIQKAYEKYDSFSTYIENETSEFNGNAMYDFSLTPMEIIQSYEPEKDKNDGSQLENPSNYDLSNGSQNRESSQTLSVQRTEGSKDHLRLSNGINSVFSGTSSRYSGDTIAAQSLESSQRHKFLSVVSQPCGKSTYTLADHVSRFKRIYRGLIHLKNAVSNDDMLSILDMNLRHAELWRQVTEFEATHLSSTMAPEQAILTSSMCSAYTNNLKRQREEATMMKVTFFESSVKRPLTLLLNFCDGVKTQLKDLNSLKKDYMMYLRQKSSHTVDVKRDIIGKHFEQIHRKMAQELPRFIELIHQMLKYLILNYHKVMLKYLEISAGGESFIVKDLEQLGKLKRDVGKNYDILQLYSTARYCAKRMVREHWQFDQDPTSSRILRKLFEL